MPGVNLTLQISQIECVGVRRGNNWDDAAKAHATKQVSPGYARRAAGFLFGRGPKPRTVQSFEDGRLVRKPTVFVRMRSGFEWVFERDCQAKAVCFARSVLLLIAADTGEISSEPKTPLTQPLFTEE